MANIEQGIKNQMPRLVKQKLQGQVLELTLIALDNDYFIPRDSNSAAAITVSEFYNSLYNRIYEANQANLDDSVFSITKSALANQVISVSEEHKNDPTRLAANVYEFIDSLNLQ